MNGIVTHDLTNSIFSDGDPDCFPEETTTEEQTSEVPVTTTGESVITTRESVTTTESPITSTGNPGRCNENDVSFHPFPGHCQYYILCACGTEVLMQCAPGLHFDPSRDQCNFEALVECPY